MYARIERSLNAWFDRNGRRFLASLYLLGVFIMLAMAYRVWQAFEDGYPLVGTVGAIGTALATATLVHMICQPWDTID